MKFKNEVMVGLVVLLAIAVAIAGAIWLSGKHVGRAAAGGAWRSSARWGS